MTLDEYQKRAVQTRVSCPNPIAYAVLGLAEEVGEICGKFAKLVRDNDMRLESVFDELSAEERIKPIKDELGDALWMIANLTDLAGLSLGDVAQANLAKLARRQQLGTIRGSGDHR